MPASWTRSAAAGGSRVGLKARAPIEKAGGDGRRLSGSGFSGDPLPGDLQLAAHHVIPGPGSGQAVVAGGVDAAPGKGRRRGIEAVVGRRSGIGPVLDDQVVLAVVGERRVQGDLRPVPVAFLGGEGVGAAEHRLRVRHVVGEGVGHGGARGVSHDDLQVGVIRGPGYRVIGQPAGDPGDGALGADLRGPVEGLVGGGLGVVQEQVGRGGGQGAGDHQVPAVEAEGRLERAGCHAARACRW